MLGVLERTAKNIAPALSRQINLFPKIHTDRPFVVHIWQSGADGNPFHVRTKSYAKGD